MKPYKQKIDTIMKTKKKMAVCFETHKWDELIDRLFFEIYYKLNEREDIDVWIIAQDTNHEEKFHNDLPKINNIFFTDFNDYLDNNFFYADLLHAKQWQQVNWLTGLYDFVYKHQEYDAYMFVEPDVMFNGDWNYFVEKIPWTKYDLILENPIQSTVDEEYWYHYNTMVSDIRPKDIYHSLVSWFIISKKAINKILKEVETFRNDFNCYGEIFIPTMAYRIKAKIACVRTWFATEVYPTDGVFHKKLAFYDYDLPNYLLHPIKDLETYNKIKDKTKYIGNKRKI